MKIGSGSFHGRFDRLNVPAETMLIRYFEQSELLNRMQIQEIRRKRVARNFLRMTKEYARP
jgi:hypothetical protein